MDKTFFTVLALLVFLTSTKAQTPIEYGNNTIAGSYINLNGVKHYYEVYGAGHPILLIHGNGTGIRSWTNQVPFFKEKYKVYAIDNRGRGNSDLGPDTLSYLQMANDMAAFISQMKLDSVYVVGASDGGIISMLMGIYYPQHIKKIVAFGTNLWPDSTVLQAECLMETHNERIIAEEMIAKKDTSKNWNLIKLKNRLMEFQPHISLAELHKIKIPVLILSCDRDLIKEEHSLMIYKNIPQANLCILANENHFIRAQNPQLFNTTVDNFLSQPFKDYSFRFKR
ncbi:MAG: Arylesterase [Flavipsychrobacter sp.]|nr:Arylesterase [Flavipsychrobacter sp.]